MPVLDVLRQLKRRLGYLKYKKISYSQEGEDLILDRLFDGKTNGFYVDVGAHHPIRFSNTYYFYKRGWKGINIDAMPGSMAPFKLLRPRDINIECPVSSSEDEILFYKFNEPALNGFSKEISSDRAQNSVFKLIGTEKLKTLRLESLLDKHLPKDVGIDFISIDVEGLDLDVLRSNNWSKFRPKYILIEMLETYLDEVESNEIYTYLKSLDFRLVAKALNTYIFEQK